MSKEKRGGGVGKVFLGIFLGFILTLGSIVGFGCLVYFKGSISFINKFGAGIDTGSDKLNSMTLNQIVKSSTKILGNTSNYSLNDLAAEFGFTMKDEVFGVDIKDIASTPISNLSTAIKDKFNNISAYEIEGVINLSSIDGVLSSTRTFYVNNGTLYTDNTFSTEVDFEYIKPIEGSSVTIKTNCFDISNGKIEVQNRYLPLTYAMADVKNNTVAEVLNYKLVDGVYKDSNNQPVKGIMKLLAPCKVGEIETTLNDMTIVDMFGDTDGFDMGNSVFSLIDNYQTLPINQIPQALDEAVRNATIDKLQSRGLINIDNYTPELQGKIGNMKIADVINAYIATL